MQNRIEQGFVCLDAAVVFDGAELAKAIHKEADAEPRGADHLRQSFLSLRNQRFRFSRIAEFVNQQEDPRQTLSAGVALPLNRGISEPWWISGT